jgi:putative iron-dependent peroxidase
MTTPQPGIFALGHRSLHHLQLDLRPGVDIAEVRDAIARIGDLSTVVFGVSVVIAFASDIWERIAPGAAPELGRFTTRTGVDDVAMAGGQHDVWFFLQASAPDTVFDAARLVQKELAGLADVVEEWPSFTYRAGRDMTGFEDGTENPPFSELPMVATVPDGERGAGGTVVLLQRWVHDLESFEALDGPAKEQVIGRTLLTSEELPDDVRSPTAHISRVVIEDDDGEELEVFRRSAAYGGVLEHGLVFLAFSKDQQRLSRMLDNMLGIGDGVRDRLTDFSRCVSSAWYYAPPLEALRRTD